MATRAEDLEKRYEYGWSDDAKPFFTSKQGLSEGVVREISAMKSEPRWMLDLRLKSLEQFRRRPMPSWGGNLGDIDFENIWYFVRSTEKQANTWDDLPAEIKDTYDKLGIPEAEKQRLIAGVAAQYECLVGSTGVYTATRGVVPIKEIEPGDRVFALDEATGRLVVAPVRAAAQTDVRQTYAVTVGGRYARTVVGTDNHPVLCLVDARKPDRVRSRYERRWKTIGELEVGDIVAVARDLPEFGTTHVLERGADTPERFPTEVTPDLAWLLGFWLGDGCTRDDDAHRTWRVEFAVPVEDAEVRAEIARVVEALFGLRVTTPDDFRIAVNSKALVRWLQRNGLTGGARTKSIPSWVYGLPREQRLAFLGGYVDADGYVSPDAHGNVVTVTSVSTALLDDTARLAAVCGLRPSGPYEFASPHPLDGDRTITGYRLALGGDVERLGCRNPRRTSRLGKRAYRHGDVAIAGTTVRAHVTEHLGWARVTSVEVADVEPVYDIEIDGPHNFVAEGIVVHNSEVVYHKVREDLEQQGVIFLDTDTALKEHEDLFREHFTKVIPANDNKFSALNTAVWSGGSFIWIPEGVKVDIPLQAYFRINKQNMGQFERTLIIAEPGSYVHYVEGCTAPIYSSDSLHSAVVEIIVKPGARVRYTTIQNWSNNVYNLVTKRAAAYEDATMEWIDGNIGSKLTMKYPAVWLMGRGAKGEVLSVAWAGDGQHQDAGAKMVHHAPDTSSTIVSKSVSQGHGRTSYRGLVDIAPGAKRVRSSVVCDALLLDETARSDTYPYMNIAEDDAQIGHEASVSKVGDEQLFYLQSRGVTEAEALAMIVRGFIEPISRELPMEYSVELNRLISLNMEGSVG